MSQGTGFFVIDRSGSMAGGRIEKAKQEISNLKGQYKNVRIFQFNNQVEEVSSESEIKVDGGTRIGYALEETFKNVENCNYNVTNFWLITDACDSINSEQEKSLMERYGKMKGKGVVGAPIIVGNGGASQALKRIFNAQEVSDQEMKPLLQKMSQVVKDTNERSRQVTQISQELQQIEVESKEADERLSECQQKIANEQIIVEKMREELGTAQKSFKEIKEKTKDVDKQAGFVETEKDLQKCQDDIDDLEDKISDELAKAGDIQIKVAERTAKAAQEKKLLCDDEIRIARHTAAISSKSKTIQELQQQIRSLKASAHKVGMAGQTASLRKKKGEVYSQMRKMMDKNRTLKGKFRKISHKITSLEVSIKNAKDGAQNLVTKLEAEYEDLDKLSTKAHEHFQKCQKSG